MLPSRCLKGELDSARQWQGSHGGQTGRSSSQREEQVGSLGGWTGLDEAHQPSPRGTSETHAGCGCRVSLLKQAVLL